MSDSHSDGFRLVGRAVAFVFVVTGGAQAALAQGAPPGYYDTVDETDSSTLRATLHAVIDDHTRYPYTSGSTDTWDILELAQEDPSDSNRIIDVYRNDSFAKQGGGNSFYNREHIWPKSYGFPDDNSSNYPYTDCHVLRLCDDGYNSARSNKPYRNCNSGCSEYTTFANNGQGGGSGSYPGNSNWSSGSFTSGTWEVWGGKRGDVARAMFYLDVRYEGGQHGITMANEPDLILTDSESLIDSSNTGNNESVAYMGMLTVLLQWHLDDPVSDWERDRNDVVAGFQGNRNPFVDHPEWVECLFLDNCPTAGGVTTYCTAKINSQLCIPAIAGAGTPSMTDPGSFDVTASNVINNKNGLFFYGVNGRKAASFQGGFLCVKSPTKRTQIQSSAGNPPPNDCSGVYSYDFNTRIQSGVDPNLMVGVTVNGQFWSRDPADPFTTGLTDAIEFAIEP